MPVPNGIQSLSRAKRETMDRIPRPQTRHRRCNAPQARCQSPKGFSRCLAPNARQWIESRELRRGRGGGQRATGAMPGPKSDSVVVSRQARERWIESRELRRGRGGGQRAQARCQAPTGFSRCLAPNARQWIESRDHRPATADATRHRRDASPQRDSVVVSRQTRERWIESRDHRPATADATRHRRDASPQRDSVAVSRQTRDTDRIPRASAGAGRWSTRHRRDARTQRDSVVASRQAALSSTRACRTRSGRPAQRSRWSGAGGPGAGRSRPPARAG